MCIRVNACMFTRLRLCTCVHGCGGAAVKGSKKASFTDY